MVTSREDEEDGGVGSVVASVEESTTVGVADVTASDTLEGGVMGS